MKNPRVSRNPITVEITPTGVQRGVGIRVLYPYILQLLFQHSREYSLYQYLNHMDQQLEYYLKTTFQSSIETALHYSNLPAPEETPYNHKYRAIEILKSLKDSPYSFIPQIFLGDIYSDVDQTGDSLKSYQKALEIFSVSSEIKGFEIDKYYPQLLQIYNLLGLSYLNIDQNEEGVGMLAKAMSIYQGFKDLQSEGSVYHNRTRAEENATFAYYFEGGINCKEIEASHTLTLFYLAQAYAKLGFKDKSALNCGETLKRQYASKTYQLKDFSLNLMSLADYYRNNYFYSQAEYMLLVGLKLLPEEGKKRLRASFHMALGDNLKELLGYSAISFRNQQNQEEESDNVLSRKFLEFQGSGAVFPKVTLGRNLQECKSIFRKANTQYKKAHETYVLDGYVTEHIEIIFSQSKLYKHLCMVDDSPQRRINMCERRKDLLEPILKQLNPKAYINTWEKILVELSEIMNEIFDMRCSLYFGVKGKLPSEKKLKEMNDSGFKAIEYYQMIEKTLLDLKDVEKGETYYQSIVNAKFNIAKTYSKLMTAEGKDRVQYLKKSLAQYKDLEKFIKWIRDTTEFKHHFSKEENLTFEMVEMLPAKIDRVNNGVNEL